MSAWNDESRRRHPDSRPDPHSDSRGDRRPDPQSAARRDVDGGGREHGDFRDSLEARDPRGSRDPLESRDSREPRERRYPKARSPRGDRRDIYATAFALGLVLLLLIGYALRPFTRGEGVPGKVGRLSLIHI